MAKIILAEDDEHVRQPTKILLEDAGHICLDFSNGDDALEALRADPDVQLLVLDIFMPSSGGKDIVTILRNGPPKFRKIPVVLISGVMPEKMLHLHKEDPACVFLKKPFTAEELKNSVERMLKPGS